MVTCVLKRSLAWVGDLGADSSGLLQPSGPPLPGQLKEGLWVLPLALAFLCNLMTVVLIRVFMEWQQP